MLGMEEGIFPHSRSLEENTLEEERRLCYVGMTRAKERLTMLHASRRALYGRSEANLPSRFLDELPEDGVERDRLTADLVVGLRRARRLASRRAAGRACRPSRPATTSATRRSASGSSRGSSRTASSPCASRSGAERRLLLEYAPLEKL